MSPATRKVLAAWVNPGPVPLWHRRQQMWLRRNWPALYNALVELEQETKVAA